MTKIQLPYVLLASTLGAMALTSTPATAHEVSDISAISDALASGTTCETITRRYLDDMSALDASAGLNAISMVNPKALPQARAIDRRFARGENSRPLECVPIVIKDNMDVKGLPTTAGSAALADNIAKRDSIVVARLRSAGAIMIAKTNMAEWAFSPMRTISSTQGETANPFNVRYVPAGSSGGTASAVSVGMAVAGLGSDTGNSIRGPASHTGLVGLRPGIGTVPIEGIVPLLAEYDAVGPMTILAKDAAVLMDVLANPEGAWSKNHRESLEKYPLRGHTFAIVSELSYAANPPAEAEALSIFQSAVDALKEAGANVTEVSIALIEKQLQAVTACMSFRHGVRKYLEGSSADVDDPLDAFVTGNFSPQAREAFAYWVSKDERDCPRYEEDSSRRAVAHELESLMKHTGADALIYPTWTFPPATRERAVEDYRGDNSQVLAPVSGLPAISVPSGRFESGLPAGLQLVGRRGDEALLIALAHAFQERTGHFHPPLYQGLPALDQQP